MNCCPTCPVAPRIPTSILIVFLCGLSLRPLLPLRPCVRGGAIQRRAKKKADAVYHRSAVGRSRCVTGLALAHTHSDTAGPLSAEALSSVRGEVHEGGSIAWVADATSVVPCMGATARRRDHRSRRPAVRVGTGLGAGERAPPRNGAGGGRGRLGVARPARH